MTEQTPKPTATIQPLRLNLYCSLPVIHEAEAKIIYEKISNLLTSINAAAIVSGNMTQMLSPCCGDKKNDAKLG